MPKPMNNLTFAVFFLFISIFSPLQAQDGVAAAIGPTELQQRAEQGDAQAQYRLGIFFEQQGGTPEYRQQAFRWFKAAAEQGHSGAQVSLGNYYRLGGASDQNMVEAVKWYTRASQQGDTAGHFALGRMYYRGQGVAQDYRRAFSLYELAARAGHASAQAALGYMSDNGLGTKTDEVQALKWYLLSAEKWFTANGYVYYMRQKMDDQAIEAAGKLAAEYKAAHYAGRQGG